LTTSPAVRVPRAATTRPTLAVVDLAALESNVALMRRLVAPAQVMVVVKADAYGHGAAKIAKTLVAEGCGHFGVATIAEASELRDAGIRTRIYLLGGFFPEQAKEILALEVTPFIFDVSIVAPLNAAAKELGKSDVAVHLKIDTGATRLGVLPSELARAIEELRAATALRLEGACTLFANAADPTSDITDKQLRVFLDALATLTTAGLRAEIVHADIRPRWCCVPTRISISFGPASQSTDCRPCLPCVRRSS
jgi:alanine racemase